MNKTVVISDKVFNYNTFWSDQILEGKVISFDTETTVTEFPIIPELVLASASNSKMSYLIHPSKIMQFIQKHKEKHFVFQNIAFDFWVIEKYLRERQETDILKIWFGLVDKNLMHDTMLLDMLYRLAINDEFPRPRDLAVITKKYTDLDISKEDPYRIRYGEIIGKDWDTIDQGFFEYAIKDPIVTYHSFAELYKKCKELALRGGVSKDNIKKYGPLTEAIQIKGAIALSKTTNNGFCLDTSYANTLYHKFKEIVNTNINLFLADSRYSGIFKRHKKTGEMQYTKNNLPSMSLIVLREVLVSIAKEIEEEKKIKVRIPKTEKGQIGTSVKAWDDYIDMHPFLQAYSDLQEYSKLCQFFAGLKSSKIHPRYSYMVRSGRVSSYNINLQQIPKGEGFREIFMASEGHLLVAIDYAFIELRTLAAVLEQMYGKSILADVIREGKDPHCHTAAMFLDLSYEDFLKLKNTNEKLYKKSRQDAKVVNFGVPGGLGVLKLKDYAHYVYHVEFTEEQAKDFREKLITKVYPELGRYLQEDTMQILADNLGCSVNSCWNMFDWKNERNSIICIGIKNIIQGNKVKKDGTPYNKFYVNKVWEGLNRLNRNETLAEVLNSRVGSDELAKNLFWTKTTTLTGRIRGRCSYSVCKNNGFQGLAADGAKLALWKLIEQGYKIIGFVHDEIITEVPCKVDENNVEYLDKEQVDKIYNIMCEEMEAVTNKIPIKGDFGVSKKWKKDAKIKIINNRIYPVNKEKK